MFPVLMMDGTVRWTTEPAGSLTSGCDVRSIHSLSQSPPLKSDRQMTEHALADLTADFTRARADLLDWFTTQAMPLWSTAGTDWVQGGFAEKLDTQGLPVDEPRRTRVVARQVYVFSVACKLGWAGDAPRWVDHGLDFLLKRQQQPDGTFASSVTPEGQVVNARFDLYEQAFALFAMATAYRLDPAARPLLPAASTRVLGALRSGWAHPVIGFEESAPASVPLRSNPHMHLFEAALQWSEALPVGPATSVTPWRALADELATLALRHLIDAPSGLVTELFAAHWEPMPGTDGTLAEPGHQFEWGWLLIRWARQHPNPQHADVVAALAAAKRMVSLAEAHGIDGQRGVAINEINTDLSVRDAHAKLWPQTERIKAWVAMAQQAQAEGQPEAMAQALQAATAAMVGLRAYLHHPVPGAWQEVWRADGSWQPEPVRASSLYHIVCALETLADAADFE